MKVNIIIIIIIINIIKEIKGDVKTFLSKTIR